MKKLKMIIGDNFDDVNKAIISKINLKDLSKRNYVIVPDRFSLLAERLIFDTLNISAYFNLSVIGISGLADIVLKENNVKFDYVNKVESKLIIRQVLKKINDKLNYFTGKISNGIIDLLYNSISIFKSNEISPQKVLESSANKNELVKNKLVDLYLIYHEYELLLDGKLDGTGVLSIVDGLLESINLSNYNFYYVNFDSFTKQGFSIIKKLAQKTNTVIIGTVLKTNSANSYIYEQDIYEKMSTYSKEEGFDIEIENICNSLNSNQKIIQENLFAISKNNYKNNGYLEIYECNNIGKEVLAVALEIKKLLVNKNCRFKDIAVAVGGLSSYQEEIEKIFSEFNFSYYVDKDYILFDTTPIQFIYNILLSLKEDASILNFQNVILSEFSDLTEKEKNIMFDFIQKYDIKNDILKNNFSNQNINEINNKITSKLNELIKIKNKSKLINNYLILIKKIIKLFNLEEKNNKIIDKLKQKNQMGLEKIYKQIFEILSNILDSIEKIMGNSEIEFEEFLEILEDYLTEQKVSSVPLNIDSIFVGDSITSFFESVDYLFILGANESNLPSYLNDISILNDEILEELSDTVVITPTVKMINRRNRFKVFSLFLKAKKRLTIFYSILNSSEEKLSPCLAVKDLLEIFNIKVVNYEKYIQYFYYEDKNLLAESFVERCGTLNNAKHEVLKLNNLEKLYYKDIVATINALIITDLETTDNLKDNKVQNLKKLFFKNNKTKISQIENFYRCPFNHFMTFGLKLKEQELATVNAAEIGQYLHKVAQEFLEPENNYINLIEEDKLKLNKIVDKIIEKLEKNNLFSKFLLKINNYPYNIVKKECYRLCNYFYLTSFKTKFKPKYLEVYFDNNSYSKISLNVNDEEFNLVGVIDRVDEYKNYLVVIDYKSGKTARVSYTELYYGEKLQIFVYAKAIQNLTKKQVCGLYYFPINNAFNENDEKPYFLSGKSLFEADFLEAMDTTLDFKKNKSQIFPCILNNGQKWVKSGERTFKKINMESKEMLNNLIDYSIKMVGSAIEEILDNNLEVSPMEGACKYCKYKGICQKSRSTNERKNIYKVTREYFEKDVKS